MKAHDTKLFMAVAEGEQGLAKVPELNPVLDIHANRAAKVPCSREVRKEFSRRERLHKGVSK